MVHMSSEDAMLDRLTEYGLTFVQAKIYIILTRFGGAKPGRAADELGVHRSEVYRVSRELVKKGVAEEHKGRPIRFTPAPPKEALNTLLNEQEERIRHLKENVPTLVEWLNSQAQTRYEELSVLLIEDDETVSNSLSKLLKSAGHKVEEAKTGSEALKKNRENHYDIALIDIRLPDFDGTKLLKQLKKKNPKIVEIIITGYPSIQNAIEAVNEGADAYLVKPIKPAVLLSKIKEKMKQKK